MTIITGGPPMSAKNLYSFVRNVKVPTVGQLREPVEFYRDLRRPVVGPHGEVTDQMDDVLTPYHNAFAWVWQAQEASLDGQDIVNTTSHVFIVRAFDTIPEVRDGVLWNRNLHAVQGTRNLPNDPEQRFLLVICQREGRYTDEPRTNTNDHGDAANDLNDPMNPLWM